MDIDLIHHHLADSKLSGVHKTAAKAADQALKEKELKKACQGFEAIFFNTILKAMRDSLPGDSLLGESNSTNIYKSMYDQYLSEELSKKELSLGLKEFLFKQLKDSL